MIHGMLHVLNKGDVEKATVKVYDKRGVLLYEAKGFETEWDGYFNGQVLPNRYVLLYNRFKSSVHEENL